MAITGHPNLQVKSYFAASVTDAIGVARRELGSDALFLNSRSAPPEARHLGSLEVIFGIAAEQHLRRAPSPAPTAAVDDLCHKIDRLQDLLMGSTDIGMRPKPGLGVQRALVDAGLTAALAAEIEGAVASRLNPRSVTGISLARKPHEWEPDRILQETIGEIESRVNVKPTLSRVTALVGPPGSGKTTTLVKLAVNEGLKKSRPVRLISADTERIGASDQLRNYAAILGASFECVDTRAGLAHAVESAPGTHLILIDTPGFSPALLQTAGIELADFLASRQDIDTQLVLTATIRQNDLEATVKRFNAFRPSGLIFTRLDETDNTGSVASEAIRSGKPISWLCGGQLVPEDIEPASKSRIVSCVVNQLQLRLRSAA